MAEQKRYVIADEPGSLWGHLFDETGRETMTRFVFDREQNALVALQVRLDGGWENGSDAMIADLEDSLVNANPDALTDPGYWGLVTADEHPSWATIVAPPAKALR